MPRARQRRALDHCFELGPGDREGEGHETAVGGGLDLLRRQVAGGAFEEVLTKRK